MTTRTLSFSALGALALGLLVISPIAAPAQDAPPQLRLSAARVSIAGTSNIHPFTASTTDVRMSRLVLAPADGDRLQSAAKAGGVEAFDIAIRAASLTSPKEGLDKNMHKALKVQEHPDITFRLVRFEPGQAGAVTGIGILKIAGVEREVALNLKTRHDDSKLTVTGKLDLLMTDYGITPPKAMLGMLKTDPKITVTFDTVFALPQVTTF